MEPETTPSGDAAVPDRSAERALFRRLADGELSESEFRAVEERLQVDAAFRARYVRAMDLEAGLYEAFATPAPVVRTLPQPRRRLLGAVAVALAVTVAALVVVLVLNLASRPDAKAIARRQPAEAGKADGPAEAEKPFERVELAEVGGAQFVEAKLRGLKDVAIITDLGDFRPRDGQSPLKLGRRLKPGVLTLGAGRMQLEFLNGAQVVIEGPAELHILSADAATLIAGKAAARVPKEAQGFVLNAPDAAVVDLGTEFAMSVDESGRSEVHVIDGEVEVSLLGEDGNTLISQRIEQAQTLQVSHRDADLLPLDAPSVALPAIRERPAAKLDVTEEYVRDVLDLDPLLYWRFESTADGVVPNEAGPQWGARLTDGTKGEPAVAVGDGVLRFAAGAESRYVGPVEALPALNVDSFSIECWVNPDMLHWAGLVAVIPEGEVWSGYHLNVIELVHRTSLVHTPGAFRFLHRHPPNRGGGVNLFSNEGCTPGQWHHVVSVKTPADLRLYMDGQLVKRIETPIGNDDFPYRLVLGQLRETTTERQFVGSMDEFAVYLRALSDEDVGRHYRALQARETEK